MVALARPTRRVLALASWLVGLALFLGWAGAAAAEPIEVTLDRIQVEVGEPIALTVTVSGKLGSQLSLPTLPDYVVAQGPSQRSVTNIVNFQVKQYTEYVYTLIARRPGSFTIGPVQAVVDGLRAASAPYPFEVKITAGADGSSQGRDLFVEATADPAQVYPGQQVMYTLRIFRAVQVTTYRYGPPSFDGFLEEPMDESSQSESVAQIDGRQYVVKEVRHALFPTRAGILEIGPATVVAEVVETRRDRRRRGRGDPFDVLFDSPFGSQTESRELVSAPVKVEVKQLPPGAPEDFYGLVGDFQASWQLSDVRVVQGASTTLTITVEGTGNVRDIEAPKLSLDGFKSYEDTPTQQLSFDPVSRRLRGRKQFKVALVPLKEGERTLAPARLSFFDPSAGRYRTVTTEPLTLRVSPGTGEAAESPVVAVGRRDAGREVEVVGEDILPLKAIDAPEGERPFGPTHPLALGLFFAPPLGFLGLVLVSRAREREAADPAGRRRRRALAEALKGVASAREVLGADPKEACRRLDRATAGFIADRLNLEGRALTPDEATARLAAAGASASLQDETGQHLQALAQAQYMPAAAVGSTAAERCDASEALLKRLDRELP